MILETVSKTRYYYQNFWKNMKTAAKNGVKRFAGFVKNIFRSSNQYLQGKWKQKRKGKRIDSDYYWEP
jgi:hypothetical protein